MSLRVQGHGGGGSQWKRHVQAAIGGMHMSGNLGGVPTVNPGAGTFVPVGNGAPAHPLFVLDPSVGFEIILDPPASPNETQFQRLRYTGSARDLCALITCTISAQDPGLVAFGFAAKLQLNGVDIPGSEQEAQTGGLITSADSLTIQGGTILNPGDDIRVLMANLTDGNDWIISSAHLTVLGF